jgi:hypothetical protein
MNILKYQKFLEEKELNLRELGNTGKDGEMRGNVLAKKLKDKDPLITNGGEEVRINKMKDISSDTWVDPKIGVSQITDPNGKYDPDNAKNYFIPKNTYKKLLKSGKKDYKLNDFKKTPDFGSSGAGKNTQLIEVIQSIFLDIKQQNPDVLLQTTDCLDKLKNYFRNNIINVYYNSDKIKLTLDSISEITDNKDWRETFCNIPNRLWNRVREPKIERGRQYNLYHISYHKNDSPYHHLLSKYKSFAKSGGFSDINETKWCPADVYLISKSEQKSVNELIDRCDSLESMNVLVDELFDNGILIPISLKKISKSTLKSPDKGKFTVIINREVDKELPEFEITSFIIGSNFKGMGSKISTKSLWKYRNNKNVDVKDRVMNFDSSSVTRGYNIDGEVEGSSSRQGKLSFDAIKRILGNPETLQTSKELRKLNIDELEQMVIDLSEEIKKSNMVKVVPMNRGENIKGNQNRLVCRIQSLQVILSFIKIYDIEPSKANEIITKLMRYALSIQTDKFDTPRYLRII